MKEAYEILEEITESGPVNQHKLTYDSPTETLEPIYFFILELMEDFGFDIEKLVDNFVSSPGSGHFGEMGQRANIMQQNGSKLLGDINTVIRSIITIVYDLRDFKIRLEAYKDIESKDEETKKAARLSLKQIWMDKVDIQKGNSSIKSMALSQAGFVTLIDAFLVCDNEKNVEKLDLNDIVKRVLKPRIQEFNHWVKYSKSELEKRFKTEKEYLRSQVNSLKTYVNWAKPYLKAADDLRMKDGGRNPALVKMFNTIVLELTLLGTKEVKPSFDPPFGSYKPKKKYYQIVLVDFDFRGIPQRTQEGYSSGGKTIINFRGYFIDDEKLIKFREEFDKSELNDGLRLVEGITENSLGALTQDIDYFLEDKEPEEKKEEKKKEKPRDTSNPFLALFGIYNKKEKKEEKKKDESVKLNSKDKKMEKSFIVPQGEDDVTNSVDELFNIYKKAHGMPPIPD